MAKTLLIAALATIFSASAFADAFEKNLTKKGSGKDTMSPEAMYKADLDVCRTIATRMGVSSESEFAKDIEKNCVEEARQNYQMNLDSIRTINAAAFQRAAEERAKANRAKDDTAKQLENSDINVPLVLK